MIQRSVNKAVDLEDAMNKCAHQLITAARNNKPPIADSMKDPNLEYGEY